MYFSGGRGKDLERVFRGFFVSNVNFLYYSHLPPKEMTTLGSESIDSQGKTYSPNSTGCAPRSSLTSSMMFFGPPIKLVPESTMAKHLKLQNDFEPSI